jgi:hypothetical protein
MRKRQIKDLVTRELLNPNKTSDGATGPPGPTGPSGASISTIGVTGSILFRENNNTITGATGFIYTNNTVSLDGTTQGRFIVATNPSITSDGKDLIIQAGNVASESVNKYGGNLLLRPGIMAGYGSMDGLGSVNFQQQFPQKYGYGTQGYYINTRINMPIRPVENSLEYKIFTFNFVPNKEAVVMFHISTSVMSGDLYGETGITATGLSVGKNVIIRHSEAGVITSTMTSLFPDTVFPNTGVTASAAWTIGGTGITGSISTTYSNLPESLYIYQSITVDNLLYHPLTTTIIPESYYAQYGFI